MRNKCAIFLAFSLLLTSVFTQFAFANGNVVLDKGGIARVTRVLDGNSVEVQMVESNEVAVVKLIGINPTGDQAQQYLISNILNQNVGLSFDNRVVTPTDGWNNMYVTLNGMLVNQQMIDRNIATMNNNHQAASMFSGTSNDAPSNKSFKTSSGVTIEPPLNQQQPTGAIVREQYYPADARRGEEYPYTYINGLLYKYTNGGYERYLGSGRYDYYYNYDNRYYNGDGININTASSGQLADALNGVDANIAREIVSYRERQRFENIDMINSVAGFNSGLFERNRNIMTVSTNINTASRAELMTLKGFTSEDAEAVIRGRQNGSYGSVDELVRRNIISVTLLDNNREYMTSYDRGILYYNGSNYVEPKAYYKDGYYNNGYYNNDYYYNDTYYTNYYYNNRYPAYNYNDNYYYYYGSPYYLYDRDYNPSYYYTYDITVRPTSSYSSGGYYNPYYNGYYNGYNGGYYYNYTTRPYYYYNNYRYTTANRDYYYRDGSDTPYYYEGSYNGYNYGGDYYYR